MTTSDASLETGDAVIDWQHRELFAIVDDLRAACEQGRAEHHVDLILDRMMLYAANHFAAEEKLMESRGYDLGEALFHQRDHIRLKQHVAGLVERRHRGDLNRITR